MTPRDIDIFGLLAVCRGLGCSTCASGWNAYKRIGNSMCNSHIPGGTATSLPRHKSESIRTLTVGSNQAMGLLNRWNACSRQGPPNQVVEIMVTLRTTRVLPTRQSMRAQRVNESTTGATVIIIIVIIFCPWYLIPKGLRNYASKISWCDWLRNQG